MSNSREKKKKKRKKERKKEVTHKIKQNKMAFRSTSTKLMAGVSRSKNFRLTLEQLRIYKKVGY